MSLQKKCNFRWSCRFPAYLILLGSLFAPDSGILAYGAQEKGQEDIEAKANKNRWLALPIIYYTPETRWALGAFGGYLFRTSRKYPDSRPSSLRLMFEYTQNKQWMFGFFPEIYLKNDEYLIQGWLILSKFVDKFYGLGNATSADISEKYTSRITNYFLRLQKRLRPHFNLAVQHEYQNNNLIQTEPGGMLAPQIIFGSEPSKISGFSLITNWDSRDNIYYPTQGSFHEASASFFRRGLGSDYNFNRYILNLRKYITLQGPHILALQGYFSFIAGDAPFQILSYLGGPLLMRGYYLGRFRDQHAAALQAEYRAYIWKRLGVAAFVGFGDVANKLSQFVLKDLKTSIGLGLRFAIDPKEKVNFRFDIAFGRDSSAVYFTATEAF